MIINLPTMVHENLQVIYIKMYYGTLKLRYFSFVRSLFQKTEEQTTQWPKDRRTENTMAKRQKNRQHNGQKTGEQTIHGQKTEEQTIQWPKGKNTNNDLQNILIKLKIE
jgi:hypothetical protein